MGHVKDLKDKSLIQLNRFYGYDKKTFISLSKPPKEAENYFFTLISLCRDRFKGGGAGLGHQKYFFQDF